MAVLLCAFDPAGDGDLTGSQLVRHLLADSAVHERWPQRVGDRNAVTLAVTDDHFLRLRASSGIQASSTCSKPASTGASLCDAAHYVSNQQAVDLLLPGSSCAGAPAMRGRFWVAWAAKQALHSDVRGPPQAQHSFNVPSLRQT